MREWLPEDDLVYVVLDAVATLDLGGSADVVAVVDAVHGVPHVSWL